MSTDEKDKKPLWTCQCCLLSFNADSEFESHLTKMTARLAEQLVQVRAKKKAA